MPSMPISRGELNIEGSHFMLSLWLDLTLIVSGFVFQGPSHEAKSLLTQLPPL